MNEPNPLVSYTYLVARANERSMQGMASRFSAQAELALGNTDAALKAMALAERFEAVAAGLRTSALFSADNPFPIPAYPAPAVTP